MTECQWPLRGLGLDFPCDFLGLARLDLFLYFHVFTFVFRSRIRLIAGAVRSRRDLHWVTLTILLPRVL